MGTGGGYWRLARRAGEREAVLSRCGVVVVSSVRGEDYWNAEGWLDEAGPDRRRAERLAIQFYGGLSAASGDAHSPEVPPSLATCEQLPMTDAVPGISEGPLLGGGLREPALDALGAAFRLGVDDVDRAVKLVGQSSDAPETLWHLLECGDEDRREKGLALLEVGAVSEARRFAACGQESVQLLCPDGMAGGCGHEENYVPITCDHRLCEKCMKRRIGKLVEKYKSAVRSWDAPVFGTFTIENVSDPVKGVEAVQGAFGRLRRRTIPVEGETRREGAVKRWCWWRDGGQPAERWKVKLQEAGRHDLVRRLQNEYVEQGRNIPFDELVRGGFYAIDVKQVAPGEYNVHLHSLMDMSYIPQAALSAVWAEVSGAPVCDVRRVYEQGGETLESAVAETVAYACKSPEFESIDDAAEFATEMKGKRLVQPFGSLHGNTPDLEPALLCANCGMQPAWWTYLGVVDHHLDNMGSVHGTDGDRPPPEGAGDA